MKDEASVFDNLEIPQAWRQYLPDQPLLDNSADRWLLAFVVFLVAAVVFRIIKAILLNRAEKLVDQTEIGWDDTAVKTLQQTRWWFILVIAAFCGSLMLQMPDEKYRHVLQTIAILTLLAQAALWGNVFIQDGVERHIRRRAKDDPAAAMTISALAFVGKLILFSLLFLLALDNLGIDVTALIAGLGVGGIAVALAVQNILGDLLASLSIVFDKPFVPGDFIIVGDLMGTVEKIGLKTTRIRSLSGEQLVFANNDLLQSRIRNYKRMQERRVVFSVGATYDTSHEKLKQIPQALQEIVQSQEQVRFDRAHFKQFGASSLDFEIVYYVLSADYNLYMDIQQSINLAVYERFEQLGVEFAFPTQTIYLENADRAGN